MISATAYLLDVIAVFGHGKNRETSNEEISCVDRAIFICMKHGAPARSSICVFLLFYERTPYQTAKFHGFYIFCVGLRETKRRRKKLPTHAHITNNGYNDINYGRYGVISVTLQCCFSLLHIIHRLDGAENIYRVN